MTAPRDERSPHAERSQKRERILSPLSRYTTFINADSITPESDSYIACQGSRRRALTAIDATETMKRSPPTRVMSRGVTTAEKSFDSPVATAKVNDRPATPL